MFSREYIFSFVCSVCLLKLRRLSMMTPKYLYCLTISKSCLSMWKALCCFELALKAIILILSGEKCSPRSLALDAVVSMAVCSFLAGLGPCQIMAMSSV